jgi:multidrug efflux pump subunit AcrB
VNKGEILVKLKPKNVRKRSITEIIKDFKKSCSRLKGTVLLFHQPTQEKIDESFSGLPALFGVTIYGTDMNKLISLAGKIETILSEEPSVASVVNNTKIKVPEIDVKINYPLLARYRVDAANILTTLSAARFGVEATKIIKQKEQISVLVKMDLGTCKAIHAMDTMNQLSGKGRVLSDSNDTFNSQKMFGINTIGNLPIQTMDGKWIPLERVAEVTISHAPSAVTRLNGQREITLLAEVDGSIPSVVKELSQKFKSVKLPRGYSIDFTGQYHVLIETVLEMIFAVLAAMVLIYLIMAMQFQSWLQPLVILMTIPLSLAGALIGLAVTGQGIDISAGMGTVTLVGIAVNNAIVLIDFANRERFTGKNTNNALLSAASVRLRPILLTSLTTIAALLPAATGTTVGSNLFQSFAITIISGLAGGIIATLIVIPSVMAEPAVITK